MLGGAGCGLGQLLLVAALLLQSQLLDR